MTRTMTAIFVVLVFISLPSCTLKKVNYQYSETEYRSFQRIKEALYEQYRDWQNTPFQNGGLSKKGIDCSGFVYLTFLNKFSIHLPRTTENQAASGNKVKRKDLLPGDLVFFKTGWFSHHVGICIENERFLHVSESQGVIISSLANQYWSDALYLIKRVDIH